MSESRTVFCVKFKQQLPGLEKPPFKGEIGQKIFDNISEKAWLSWREDMQVKVINEYRLNLADRAHYEKLVEQMLKFLNLEEGAVLEVENAERGRGN
jgi:Fe-S cluster biosynthesis and repair protein YggX